MGRVSYREVTSWFERLWAPAVDLLKSVLSDLGDEGLSETQIGERSAQGRSEFRNRTILSDDGQGIGGGG